MGEIWGWYIPIKVVILHKIICYLGEVILIATAYDILNLMIISDKKSTIVWSTIKVSWVWRCSRNDNVMHNYLSMNVILKFGPCILVTIISVKVIEKKLL